MNNETLETKNVKKRQVKRKKKWSIWKKIGVTVGILLTLAIGTTVVYGYQFLTKLDQKIKKIAKKGEISESESAKVKPINVLVMGVDTRKDTHDFSINSDVIMALSLNPQTKSATLVSLPRDLQLDPKQEHKANYYYPHFYLKNKETAMENTKNLFGKFFDIQFDYMVTINFEGFRKVIDTLGGVEVDVEMDMRYVDKYDGTDINLKKGFQNLDGKQALDYVRYRKSNRNTAESTDTMRNMKQQKVLRAVVSKLKTINGFTKMGGILDSIGNNLETDMEAEQIKNLIYSYYNIDLKNIEYVHMEADWKSPYMVVKDKDIEDVKNKLKKRMDPNFIPRQYE